MKNNKIIFSLGNNEVLAKELASKCKIKLGKVTVSNFADGEVSVKLEDECRGKKVFLVQSTHQPDSSFIKLILAGDAARRASAEEIVAVIPYFGYSRQERLSEPGTSISTKVFATMLEAAGIDRVVVVDLHSKAIEGFFTNTIVDHINSISMFTDFLKKKFSKEISKDNIRIVAPDTGAANNARNFSMQLLGHSELAIVSKSRLKANHISSMQLVGEVANKIAIIVDDMADTCGTLVKAAELLKESGAKKVFAVVTHAIFSGEAVSRLEVSCLESVYVSNTIERANLPRKIISINMVDLLQKLIKKL